MIREKKKNKKISLLRLPHPFFQADDEFNLIIDGFKVKC